jgi:hypothetical protein
MQKLWPIMRSLVPVHPKPKTLEPRQFPGHWCRQVGCDIYFRSLPPPREGLPDECTGLEAMRLKKVGL